MKLYPKQPTGPSPLGTAQVRALDARGGDYQNSWRDANTRVRKQGEFRKVYTGGFEYLTEGQIKAGGDFVPFACMRYQLPFMPGFSRGGYFYLGSATYFRYGGDISSSVTTPYTYPITGTGARVSVHTSVRYNTLIQGEFVGFWGQENLRGTLDFTYDAHNYLFPNYTPVRAVIPNSAYLRRVPAVGATPADRIVFSPGLTLNESRVDPAGRALCDLTIFIWPERASGSGFTLSVGAPYVEFIPFMPVAVTHDYAMFLVVERFFRYEVFSGGTDYRPIIRMIRLNSKSFSLIQSFNLTSVLLSDPWLPEPTGGNLDLPGFEADFYAPDTTGVAFLNALNTDMMALMCVCPLPGNKVVIAYPAVGDVAGAARYRFRVARIDVAAPSVSLLVDDLVAGLPSSSPDPRRHYDNMVHLGGGWILAKEVDGWRGIDFDVRFMLSTDEGSTWAPLTVTGLQAPMVNQYFGKFIVHAPRSDSGDPGVILLPAWSTSAQAYHVFESRDNGISWSRRGRIAKPDEFRRVDTHTAGDGGSNFNILLPGTDLLRAVDVTMPDRYNQ